MEGVDESGTAIAGRYILDAVIGEGGAAVVYRAKDALAGKDVVLKRLRAGGDANMRQRYLELFEREFHTLAALAHPNVVAAYDFGVHNGAPYYTMELLDGGDLADRAPLPWRAACALARDMCSVLSLIHSRRMVYRDLSPRNIRCASDGTAKLIDFGAMTAMGPTKYFVGTPAISSPEAVLLQPLDARADLYSLGAALYFALCARRPFPARAAQDLIELWKSRPPLPSQLVADIPEALDALVMDLLQVDPAHRPASAAEVMARLSAVAGFSMDEARLVSRAYLSTPNLVGRQAAQDHVQQTLASAVQGQGGAILVKGRPGSGRTRFLDACVLAGKMVGATPLRADASDFGNGDYAAVRSLAIQLLEAAPATALAAARKFGSLLSYAVPELRERAPGDFAAAVDPDELQTRLKPALRDWFLALSKERPLVIAVDDVHRVDAPSAAVAALIARAKDAQSLLLVTTASDEEGLASSTLSLIAEASRVIALDPLTEDETATMLRSVFGDVPHVQHLAHRIQAISHGLPRDIIELAQHLVDRGVARYHAGVWSLPQSLEAHHLPENLLQALRERVQALRSSAKALAQTMALHPNTRYSLDECAKLSGGASTREVLAELDALVAADILAAVDGCYQFSRQGIHAAVLSTLEPERRAELHLRLADVFAARKSSELLAASHLLHAGSDERAIDLLVSHARASVEETDASPAAFAQLLQSLPSDWFELYDRAAELCRVYGRPRSDAFTIHTRVAGIAAFTKVDATSHFAALFAQLRHDAGLDLYESLGDLAPRERLRTALGRAAQRFAETPAHERCADPKAAIRLLVRATAAGAGSAGIAINLDLWRLFPCLTPLLPLSPAVGVAQRMAAAVGARMMGAHETANELYEGVLQSLDTSGLDVTYQKSTRLNYTYLIATTEASMGIASSLARAAEIEAFPLFEVNATIVRMLYHLWQGDLHEAERCKKRIELLNLEGVRAQGSEGAHLFRELPAYTALEDLTRVRQILDSIEPMATKFAGWRPILHWGQGEYERIRGDLRTAQLHFEEALRSMPEEGHPAWADVAGASLKTLLALGRHAEAAALGLAYLERAEARSLVHTCNMIRMPLALALAKHGDGERAVAIATRVVEYYRAIDSTGINRFQAHETRARVALELGQKESFQRDAEQCRTQVSALKSSALAAKYERLLREAEGPRPAVLSSARHEGSATDITGTHTHLVTELVPEASDTVAIEPRLEIIVPREKG